MPKRAAISSILLGSACVLAVGQGSSSAAMVASTIGSSSSRAFNSGTCQRDIEAILQRAPAGQSRVVVIFTGTQSSLMPLYESSLANEFDVAFFPVDRSKFVLTLQTRPGSSDPTTMRPEASRLCALAQQSGARFNGVILYVGSEMTAAEMAEPEN